jgi:hypothetical protein
MKRIVLLLVFLFVEFSASAQCAMCRAVLQSGEDQGIAEGINDGIVYLMAIPYILVGGVFYFVYKKLKQSKNLK